MDAEPVAPSWRKGSQSGDDGCVEWCVERDVVRVRNSRRPAAGEIAFTHREWEIFLAAARAGEADLDRG